MQHSILQTLVQFFSNFQGDKATIGGKVVKLFH